MRYALVGILVLAIIAGLWWFVQQQQPPASTADTSTPSALAPEVENILSVKTALLVTLAAEPDIVAAVRSSNTKNAALSPEEIQRLDQEWQSTTTPTPLISGLMSNATAQSLIAFQREHAEFKEIFIADAIGLNVGQTDKTSDYYQKDESWWVDSYNDGRGRTLHGSIEFDESSQTEAISLYVPILDGGRAIGVMKGVLDLSAISAEL